MKLRDALAGGLAIGLAMMAAAVLAAAPPSPAPAFNPNLENALVKLATSARDSADEARAMSHAIAVVAFDVPALDTHAPEIPADAADHVARAQALARDAKTPADLAAAAREWGAAARRAPWVAEYHFTRGQLLAKADSYAAAADAFALYLQAAPAAGDRAAIVKLIAGLRHSAQPAAVAPANAHRPGDVVRDCDACPEMTVIPTGAFTMGSPATENGRFDSENPQHPVSVTSFALARYPVTESEFAAFLRDTGYQPAPCDSLLHKSWISPGHGLVYPPGGADLPVQPAICLSWDDAQIYIAWLNWGASSAPAAPYRLPSEAEWEYAARAGTVTARWWGEGIGTGNANCHGCGSAWDNKLIAPVGSFGPNGFGLYDMLGNVWQWVDDCWNETYADAPGNGGAWHAGDCGKRVMRGGSWSNIPVFIRSAARSRGDRRGGDFDYSSYVGFRLARNLP